QMLRDLRAQGISETAIQDAVARHGGDHWDQLFECMFGKRAVLSYAGIQDRAGPGLRRRFVDLARDATYSVLETHLQGRRDRRHPRILQEVEEKRLQNEGINILTARRKARRIAKAMLVTAVQWREEQQLITASHRLPAAHFQPLLERLCTAASHPEPVIEPHE